MRIDPKTLRCEECDGGRHSNCVGNLDCTCYATGREHQRFVGPGYGVQPTPADREYLEYEAQTVAEIAEALRVPTRSPLGRVGDWTGYRSMYGRMGDPH